MPSEPTTLHLERLGAQAWPALEQESQDGWLLRYSGTLGNRANSVLPLANGASEFDERLGEAATFYSSRGAPLMFQISSAAQPVDLVERLIALEYASINDVTVMTIGDLRSIGGVSHGIALAPAADTPWLQRWLEVEGYDPSARSVLGAMLVKVHDQQRFASVTDAAGGVVAIGRAVVQGEWLGYYNLATAPQYRRRGYASGIMGALAEWGWSLGARHAYLQVDADNSHGIGLYSSLGFEELYGIRFFRDASLTGSDSGGSGRRTTASHSSDHPDGNGARSPSH